jgi:hypothetical protein
LPQRKKIKVYDSNNLFWSTLSTATSGQGLSLGDVITTVNPVYMASIISLCKIFRIGKIFKWIA